MAHRVADVAKLRTAINKLEAPDIFKLSAEIHDAAEKLKDTRFADVFTRVDENTGEILHNVEFRRPYLAEDGGILTYEETAYSAEELPDAVKRALAVENAMVNHETALKSLDFLA